MNYKSNYKINLLLTAIVLFLLLICYLSVSRQMKADETQKQEQAAGQQMEEQFINMSEDHAADSLP